jgi:hypothetical protein
MMQQPEVPQRLSKTCSLCYKTWRLCGADYVTYEAMNIESRIIKRLHRALREH